ncbi:DgyrCDS6256 [Dimorphilus gyrociliatus]|uniref:RanBP-type and C3HC4-type zinc finger-containing protein 1 n=1 Tax=Dimorphilus gyrociliatus TaxID=2664684 RepID=A0A7I8VMI4_9ANNE|nr:DgyrCDS6256 [Dimorphilus gyrociliatus]
MEQQINLVQEDLLLNYEHYTSNCQDILERLRDAISNSRLEDAAQYAVYLAKRGLNILMTIEPKPKEDDLNDVETLFPLDIVIESINADGVKIQKNVRPSMTFEDLNINNLISDVLKMLCEYGIFPELQRSNLSDTENLREKYKKYLPHEIEENSAQAAADIDNSISENTEDTIESCVESESSERIGNAKEKKQGWECERCTFNNFPSRPGCQMCTSSRPESYKIPDDYIMSKEEEEWLNEQRIADVVESELQATCSAISDVVRYETFKTYQTAYDSPLVYSNCEFQCPVCFDTIPANEGVCLRECLHELCKECLKQVIQNTLSPEVKCPFRDSEVICNADILHSEIRGLLTEEEYNKFNERSLQVAEARAGDQAFHCKTVDCPGWCEYDDNVNFYFCENCGHNNCLTCKAIHEDQDCKTYQEDLSIKAKNDKDAFETHQQLMNLIKTGDAMKCPNCSIVLSKKAGCDWIKCSMCQTEICWATKGRRWGPGGTGDTTGGCKCGKNGERCHPNCRNCH